MSGITDSLPADGKEHSSLPLPLQKLLDRLREIAHLYSALELLQWDMEVYMPPGGLSARAEVSQTLTRLAHQKFIAPEVGEWISQALNSPSLDEMERNNLQVLKENWERARKIPDALLGEIRRQSALAYGRWKEARQKDDFLVFAPALQQLVTLVRELAQCLFDERQHRHLYDPLLQEYDRSASLMLMERISAELKTHFVPFVQEVGETYRSFPSQKILQGKKKFPLSRQWDFSLFVMRKIGFPLGQESRQDTSPHPFTTSIGPGDVRITTRGTETDLSELLLASIHEMGHGLYALDVQKNWKERPGYPVNQATNLSLHESQSRFWENFIARSLPFWEYFFPIAQGFFPDALLDVSLEEFYIAWNHVEPSLNRVRADELTYHLHILVRFEVEKSMLEENLPVQEARETWNRLYEEYLGLRPPSDREGILQDIHWAHALFGYFPTYTLGTLYAAQFWFRLQQDIPDVEEQIRHGEFSSIREWLRKHIYRWGNLKTAMELCQEVTGEPLNPFYFIQYARQKYESLMERIRAYSQSTHGISQTSSSAF